MKMVGAGVGVPSRGKPEPLTTARFEQLQVSVKDAVVRRRSASKMDDLHVFLSPSERAKSVQTISLPWRC